MRLLRAGQPNGRSGPRPGRRIYDDATREALIVIWEASDRIYSKRLRALVVQAREQSARWGKGDEALSSAGHPLRAADGGRQNEQGHSTTPGNAAGDIGSGSSAEGDPDRGTGALPAGRHSCPRRDAAADCTDAGAIPYRTAYGLAGGRGSPDQYAEAKAKRLRRRPDPLAAVTSVLRGWFEAEPWRTSRELLERLQAEYPGLYPNGLLRTCQRRLKEWRGEAALQLIFGTAPADVTAPMDDSGYPVDLPLCLDDAIASPTTPQDLQQQQRRCYTWQTPRPDIELDAHCERAFTSDRIWVLSEPV